MLWWRGWGIEVGIGDNGRRVRCWIPCPTIWAEGKSGRAGMPYCDRSVVKLDPDDGLDTAWHRDSNDDARGVRVDDRVL